MVDVDLIPQQGCSSSAVLLMEDIASHAATNQKFAVFKKMLTFAALLASTRHSSAVLESNSSKSFDSMPS